MPMLTFLTLAPEEHLPHTPNPATQQQQQQHQQQQSHASGEAAVIYEKEPIITPLTPVGGFLRLIPERGAPWSGQPPEKEVVPDGEGPRRGGAGGGGGGVGERGGKVGGRREEAKRVSWEDKRVAKDKQVGGTFAKLRRAFSVKRT